MRGLRLELVVVVLLWVVALAATLASAADDDAALVTDPNIKEVKVYISFVHGSVEYTYRRR
jgi:hypothetical protein